MSGLRYGKRYLIGAVLAAVIGPGPAMAKIGLEAASRFVDENCASCHVTAPGQPQKHAEAPDFQAIARRYPPDALAEAFAEGVVTGHADMPKFELSTEEIEKLLLFLRQFGD